jgi:hypothetical protein
MLWRDKQADMLKHAPTIPLFNLSKSMAYRDVVVFLLIRGAGKVGYSPAAANY